MKRTTTRLITLIISLLILVAIFFIKDKLTLFFASKKTSQLFPSQKVGSIDELRLKNANAETRIYLRNNQWFLIKDGMEYKANEELVNQILNSIFSLKKEEVVSRNKNHHSVLGIGQQKIIFRLGGKNYTLFIGNSYGIDKNYLRLNDEDDVFVGAGFNTVFSTQEYRDLAVHFINDETAVTAITIDDGNQKTTLEKRSTDWYSGKNKISREKVDFFLNDLKTLQAKNIIKENVLETGYYPNALNIFVKENNQEKKGEFFIKDQDSYYLKVQSSPFLFEIAPASFESLKKTETDFIGQ